MLSPLGILRTAVTRAVLTFHVRGGVIVSSHRVWGRAGTFLLSLRFSCFLLYGVILG